MAKILVCATVNKNVVPTTDKCTFAYVGSLNKQKVRRALGGRPAGTECGSSCSCS
jgi:hypothetical protein